VPGTTTTPRPSFPALDSVTTGHSPGPSDATTAYPSCEKRKTGAGFVSPRRGGKGEREAGRLGDLDGGAEGRERVGRADVLGEDQAERAVQRHVARRGVAGRGRQHRRERLLHRQHASVLFALLPLGWA
jgi:hypothetical protein